MSVLKSLCTSALLGVALLSAGCVGALQGGVVNIGDKPTYQSPVSIATPDGSTVLNLTITARPDGGASFDCPPSAPNFAYCVTQISGGAYADVSGQGFVSQTVRFVIGQAVHVTLAPAVPPLPPPPSRDTVLSGHVMFQGLTCDTVDFGVLPWFDAGLFSLSDAGRRSVYACKHAAGDTEAQILFDATVGSIYNEDDNPYFAFQSRNFAANLDAFAASVREAVQNGFIPKIYLGAEDYDNDMALFPIAHRVLSTAGPHGEDLNPYVKYSPGFDGVFYGWEPAKLKIEAFGRLVRSLCPACYLTMEFNTGHLPQEAGIDMSDYDGFDIEFGDKLQGDNNTYGILERLIGPSYNRPADDVPPNDGGDGHPRPWVTKSGTPRGPYYTNCFEWNTYAWVRSRVSAATVEQQRQWLRSIGCGSFTVPISQFRMQLRPAA